MAAASQPRSATAWFLLRRYWLGGDHSMHRRRCFPDREGKLRKQQDQPSHLANSHTAADTASGLTNFIATGTSIHIVTPRTRNRSTVAASVAATATLAIALVAATLTTAVAVLGFATTSNATNDTAATTAAAATATSAAAAAAATAALAATTVAAADTASASAAGSHAAEYRVVRASARPRLRPLRSCRIWRRPPWAWARLGD